MESLILYHSPFPKKRIGRAHDGGYVTVELPQNYDCLISGGIANDISFEQAFLDMYPNIPCYAFDGTIHKLPIEDRRIQFIRKNLGSENSEIMTDLSAYMRL